jgi:hypothetical protein
MAVNIVTGKTGDPHITSYDEKMRNAEMFGTDKFVFTEGGRLWASKVDNTHVRITSGMCMNCGTQMGIEADDNVTVELDPGSLGYNRIDLIVMRYTHDTTNDVESASLVVVKGTPAASTPVEPTPEYIDGNILSGDVNADMKLWKIVFEGTTLVDSKMEPMYKLRSGYVPTNPDDPDVKPVPDPDAEYVITAATIDKLWGSSLEDGDAEGW